MGRVFWAITEGAVAIALLQAGGTQSLKALQAVSIIAGLPFTVILMFMCTGIWRALKIDQGHMALRQNRTDWCMPLYGGVFDIFEFVLSLGKSALPEVDAIKGFLLGIFDPPLLLFRSMRGLASKQEASKKQASTMAWAALVGFAALVAVCRHNIRTVYGIEGSGPEDFFAALFMWPQVLAQMTRQVTEEVKPKKEIEDVKPDKMAVDAEMML